MNHPTFEFHPEAVREAWAAHRWYADRNPRAATSFLDEFDHAQEQIGDESEQRETLEYLMRVVDEDRLSDRPRFGA
jgi:hypothetical protein